MEKNLPARQDMWVDPWVRKILWIKKMAMESSILVWEIPWTEESGRLQSEGLQESDRT